jgi:hypothetical protein
VKFIRIDEQRRQSQRCEADTIALIALQLQTRPTSEQDEPNLTSFSFVAGRIQTQIGLNSGQRDGRGEKETGGDGEE